TTNEPVKRKLADDEVADLSFHESSPRYSGGKRVNFRNLCTHFVAHTFALQTLIFSVFVSSFTDQCSAGTVTIPDIGLRIRKGPRCQVDNGSGSLRSTNQRRSGQQIVTSTAIHAAILGRPRRGS